MITLKIKGRGRGVEYVENMGGGYIFWLLLLGGGGKKEKKWRGGGVRGKFCRKLVGNTVAHIFTVFNLQVLTFKMPDICHRH